MALCRRRHCKPSRSTSKDESRPHDRHDHLHRRSDAPMTWAGRGLALLLLAEKAERRRFDPPPTTKANRLPMPLSWWLLAENAVGSARPLRRQVPQLSLVCF